MKFVRRTLLLPAAILMFTAAFTAEERGCAEQRVEQVVGVSWQALGSISDAETIRNVLHVATAADCALRVGDMYNRALQACDAVANFSDSVVCQAEAKQEFDRLRLICLQLVGGDPGGDPPPPPPTDDPPPPPPSWEPCGGSCQAPFYCDTNTDNCICVSSCDQLCGQVDECGNPCPYVPGQCGGSGG